jgi:hypothetical protein
MYSGFFGDGSFTIVGSQGYYWSSTVATATNALNLTFASSGVWPVNTSSKGVGLAVRCVAP